MKTIIQPTRTHSLYNGDVKIGFWEKYGNSKHLFKREIDGEYTDRIISVSKILGVKDKSQALLYWFSGMVKTYLTENSNKSISTDMINECSTLFKTRAEKEADVGTQVHNWAEEFIKHQIKGVQFDSPDIEDERVKNGIISFLNWVKDNEVVFIDTERIIYSKKYNYIGICDVIFTLGKENNAIKHVGDFKTSKGIYSTMLMQVEAYKNAIQEEDNETYGNSYIIKLNKDSKVYMENNSIVTVKKLDNEEVSTASFEAFLNLFDFMKRDDIIERFIK